MRCDKTEGKKLESLGRPRPAVLRALGKHDPPLEISVDGMVFQRERIFKHDSWAATALYHSDDGSRVVCKFNRCQPIFFLPMRWLGRVLARREAEHLRLLADVPQVPSCCGSVFADGHDAPHAVAHAYIPGRPLRMVDRVSESFCDELIELTDSIHSYDMAYVDLHKRENVLVGSDGKPYLIDFQVSWALTTPGARRSKFLRWILRQLQAADSYHLRKHLVLLDPARFGTMNSCSQNRPWWIRLHRLFARPLRTLRRKLLVLFGVRRGIGRVESEHFAEDAFQSERNATVTP